MLLPIKKRSLTSTLLGVTLLTTTLASAQPVIPAHEKTIQITGATPISVHLRNGSEKTVRLMGLKLSPSTQKILFQNLAFSFAHPSMPATNHSLSPQIDLGMNQVPVLDQGNWGTCVTFATTAAIDAFYPLHGDQAVSQLCSLELGKTLKIPDKTGGWNGSFGHLVLNEISQYGYLTTAYQHQKGCGGLKEYPSFSKNNGKRMAKSVYVKNSVKTFNTHTWQTLLNETDSDNPDIFNPEKKQQLLDTVRENLAAGYRLTFGVILDEYMSAGGAIGRFNAEEDTWVLDSKMIQDISAGHVAGHEMVIIGYDDNACASFTDSTTGQITKQCGLLKLRNSWSTLAGDNGNYYMSYDFFRNLAMEVYVIGKNN